MSKRSKVGVNSRLITRPLLRHSQFPLIIVTLAVRLEKQKKKKNQPRRASRIFGPIAFFCSHWLRLPYDRHQCLTHGGHLSQVSPARAAACGSIVPFRLRRRGGATSTRLGLEARQAPGQSQEWLARGTPASTEVLSASFGPHPHIRPPATRPSHLLCRFSGRAPLPSGTLFGLQCAPCGF